MHKNFIGAGLIGLAAFATANPSSAAPITFFGENVSGAIAGAPTTARNNFLATLTGVGTETFESIADGTSNPPLSFPGSSGAITATLSGSGEVDDDAGAGRFATSGDTFYETDSGGDFTISFSSAIAAFGFFGTDIGDFGNSLFLTLTKSGGGTVDVTVGNTVGSNGSTDGALLFFGFIDTIDTYTSIAFKNDPGGVDVFGFDDLTVGDARQITNPPNPNVVPLPAGAWLLLTGIGGMAALRRRRKNT